MTGWIKSLLADSFVYGVGFGVSRFLQIIVLPIIAQSLSLAEFGYYSNYVIFYTIAGGFFLFGLDSSVPRYYYESENKSYQKTVFSSAFYYINVTCVLSVIAICFYPTIILRVIGVPQSYSNALLYVLLTVPSLALNNFFLTWFKWKRQKIYFLINSIGNVLFLLIPLLIIRLLSFLLLFKVIFFSQLSVAIISTLLSSKYIKLTIDKKLLFSMLRYGLPWMLVFVLGISRSYLDRFFLLQYLDDDTYGVYNFSVRLSTFLSLVIAAFDMSFAPLSFSIWNKPEAPKFFERIQSIYILIISMVACGISIFSLLLIQLLGGTKYIGAEKVLPFLMFSAIPLSLLNFSSLGISYAKKSYLSTLTLVIGFSCVLVLNFLLTPIYLEYGAAIASLIGHLFILISSYYFSNFYYKIDYAYKRDAVVFVVYLILSLFAVQVRLFENTFIDILTKLVLLFVTTIITLLIAFQAEYKRSLNFFKSNRYARIRNHARL